MSFNKRDKDSEQTRKLFIGGLSKDTTDDSLREYFSQWGAIDDCVAIKDKDTGAPKGFGFVTFSTEAEVDAAQAKRPHTIDGKTVDSKRAMPKAPGGGGGGRGGGSRTNKCYIGGLKDQCDEESVKNYFGQFGEIENAHFPKDKETGRAKPFAFITFADSDIADKCVIQSNHEINGISVMCSKANENKDGGGGRGGRVPDTSEIRIKKKKRKKQQPSVQTKQEHVLTNIEVVLFEDLPGCKSSMKEKPKKAVINNSKNNQKKEEAKLKAAKYDVMKFGISGLDNNSKEDAKVQLAMSLGAKAPKNKYVNYKQLMKTRKEEHEQKNEYLDKLTGFPRQSILKPSSVKKKKRKADDRYLHADGQVGHYKHGVQKLSKQDLHTIKSTKRH